MNETTAEKIEVMKAYLEGKQIEMYNFNNSEKGWFLLKGTEPIWNWLDYNFRTYNISDISQKVSKDE